MDVIKSSKHPSKDILTTNRIQCMLSMNIDNYRCLLQNRLNIIEDEL